jgi:LysR family transcriptional regulator for bpeEF and oprC
LLVPALPKFTQDYPELSLDIQFNDRVIDLVAERVDVALRVGHVTQKGLIARQIASLRVVTCAAPSYLEAHGTPRSIEELAEHRCIGLLSTGHGRLLEWIFERGTARLRHRPNCSLAFTSAEAIISAGIAGGGVLQTVDALASRAVATGQLRLILSECSTAGPPVSVVYPESSRNSAKVQVFAEFAARLMSDWRRKMGEI